MSKEGLDGTVGGLLSFQEAAVELGGFFLHPLQHGYAFPGDPERFGQCVPGNLGLGRRNGHGLLAGRGGCAGGLLRRSRSCCRSGQDRRPLRLGLDIVGPADRYCDGGFFARHGHHGLVAFVPGGQANSMAEHGQLGQGAGQVGHTGTLAAGGIQGNGRMVPFSQDSLDQAGQPGAGAGLHKSAYTIGIHGLDLGNEFHWPGQLPGQQGLGCVGIDRILGRGCIGVDRDGGFVDLDLPERGQKWYGCVGNQAAVEGGCHRQLFA